jgi:UDP-galactopyranose mutase
MKSYSHIILGAGIYGCYAAIELARKYPDVIFGGHLAEYKYYYMYQIIGSSLAKDKRLFI